MGSDRGRVHTYLLPTLLILAVGIRCYGIDWGLPAGYEEATPFRKAWDMWNWGLERGVDLNPHFFNYPSFTFYLQFIVQGLLYLAMTITGFVGSAIDFHAQYVIDKTPYFVAGRALNVAFAAAAVALVYVIGRRTGGIVVAAASGFWLAVNTAHVSRSQMIEVDVPLAFFTVLCIWLLLRLYDHPSWRNYIWAGVSVGLAASTKYTGAILGLSIVAAHFAPGRAMSSKGISRNLTRLAASLAAAVVVFVVTSPFVVLDFDTFAAHFADESEHMRVGHFGTDETPTWLYYGRVLTSEQLGWPIAILAMAGVVYFLLVRRKPWALVSAAFLVPYCIGISTWEMRAARYLMPVLPLLCLFAGHALYRVFRISYFRRWPATIRATVIVLSVLTCAVPLFASYPDHFRRLRPDTRSVAGRWVRDNIPAGSFIVTEQYGPNLPVRLVELEPEVRSEIKKHSDYDQYAVQQIPMVQMRSEISGVFYDLSLYRDADYIVTTNSVRSRYQRDPQRFGKQASFYQQLDSQFQLVRRFAPDKNAGPIITVYKNPVHTVPFGERETVDGPNLIMDRHGFSAAEPDFYFWLAYNYESYSHFEVALECYQWATRFHEGTPSLARSLVLGSARCLVALDRYSEAIDTVDRAIGNATSAADRDYYQGIREHIVDNMK